MAEQEPTYRTGDREGGIEFACPQCGGGPLLAPAEPGAKVMCEDCGAKVSAPPSGMGAGKATLPPPKKAAGKAEAPAGDGGAGRGEGRFGNKATGASAGSGVSRDEDYHDLDLEIGLEDAEDDEEEYRYLVDTIDEDGDAPEESEDSENENGEERSVERVFTSDDSAPEAHEGGEDATARRSWHQGKPRLLEMSPRAGFADGREDWELNPHRDVDRVRRERFSGRVLKLGGGVLLLAVGGVLYFSISAGMKEESVPLARLEESGEPGAGIAADVVADQRRIEAALDGFFQAGSVEEKAGFVRRPDEALPRMRTHYGGREMTPEHPDFDGQISYDQRGDKVFSFIQLVFNEAVVRAMALERAGDRFLVDWESYAGYSPIQWKDFVRGNAASSGLFRVIASEDDYYNFDFSDEEKYLCLRLADLDDTESCYGYIERHSVNGHMISTVLSRNNEFGNDSAHLILELSRVGDDAGRKQVRITQMKHDNWLIR